MPVNLEKTFYNLRVKVFSYSAAVVSVAVLSVVIGYGVTYLFYTLDREWVAPASVSPSNDRILQMTSAEANGLLSIATATLERDKDQASIAAMRVQLHGLEQLSSQLRKAINKETDQNLLGEAELAKLHGQKELDITVTKDVLEQLSHVQAEVQGNLAAGLITKTEASIQLSALNQTRNAYTDSKIGSVLLKDQILDHNNTDTRMLEILSRAAELEAEMAQLRIAITAGERQIASDQIQIVNFNKAMGDLKRSPYYQVSKGTQRLNFAFVPYTNELRAARVAPVYDCYLNFLACRQVGRVAEVYDDEQHLINPISKQEERGVLIRLDLDQLESAKSKTLFVGRKPLFF